ncbi:hypothetical protein L596_016283 [Steinernema carpocapsae]|uniref:Methyltransferase domain-containing protein n=1 Tax=Steinernema carpocapsae TaxID=34508 RepID=A0A4U5NIB3_STECR|nr:hypothetical protein L596_016283 [Steinernema carpocapsae]
MAAWFARNFLKLALKDVARQYEFPVKSGSGAVLTRMWARQSRPLEEAAVEKLDFGQDDNVLEIGYGRGDGIAAAYNRIAQGKGVVFGVERSDYMQDVVRNRFALEIAEDERIHLDRALDLSHLPYPSDFFAGAFHVNAFYFWRQDRMHDILWEMARILKPGAQLVCAVDPQHLQKMLKWATLTESQCNVLRYIEHLEPAGFENIKVEYHPMEGRDIQLITAEKSSRGQTDDPEEKMKTLEQDIKKFMLEELIRQKARPGMMKEAKAEKTEEPS